MRPETTGATVATARVEGAGSATPGVGAPRSDEQERSPHLLLQAWLSPSFPVGSFAYSHGLETAVDRRWVTNVSDLEHWLADLVGHGALGNDLVLLAHAWRAAELCRWSDLAHLAELGVALQPTPERRLEATQQGGSFLVAVEAAWPCEAIGHLARTLGGAEVTYPVVVAVAAAGHGVALAPALSAFALAFLSAQVSAAIRLSVVGQVDGQRVTAALLPRLEAATRRAAVATLDDLASATMLADVASLMHETQYTRLFRS